MLRVVDVSEPPSGVGVDAESFAVPVVAVGSLACASEFWLQQATFTLTEDDTDDHRAITVDSIDSAIAELAAQVDAAPDSVFGLPELRLGVIPGAGGTVSVTRRIGRWRTAYLVLSGVKVDADMALAWGLADAKS